MLSSPAMQTLHEIRELLASVGAHPNKKLGQCFMIDKNLLAKVLDLAELSGGETVLEVGPGTGTLTEELLSRAGRVVAVEIDRALQQLIAGRFGSEENFTLISGDILAGKSSLSPEVLAILGSDAQLVANLPYSIATPLIALCLGETWHGTVGGEAGRCRFSRLTFTVQKEVGDRLIATPGSGVYGPVSILVQLLASVIRGPMLPPGAFWPAPKVDSCCLRIDFDPQAAAEVADVAVLQGLVSMAFAQRRKQLGSMMKRRDSQFDPDKLRHALAVADIDITDRAEVVEPSKFLVAANVLSGSS